MNILVKLLLCVTLLKCSVNAGDVQTNSVEESSRFKSILNLFGIGSVKKFEPGEQLPPFNPYGYPCAVVTTTTTPAPIPLLCPYPPMIPPQHGGDGSFPRPGGLDHLPPPPGPMPLPRPAGYDQQFPPGFNPNSRPQFPGNGPFPNPSGPGQLPHPFHPDQKSFPGQFSGPDPNLPPPTENLHLPPPPGQNPLLPPYSGQNPHSPNPGHNPNFPNNPGHNPNFPNNPGHNPNFPNNPGNNLHLPQPGQNPNLPHPGQNPHFPQPGQNPNLPLPGQNPNFPHPGQNPNFLHPGQNPNLPHPGQKPQLPIPGHFPQHPGQPSFPHLPGQNPVPGQNPQFPNPNFSGQKDHTQNLPNLKAGSTQLNPSSTFPGPLIPSNIENSLQPVQNNPGKPELVNPINPELPVKIDPENPESPVKIDPVVSNPLDPVKVNPTLIDPTKPVQVNPVNVDPSRPMLVDPVQPGKPLIINGQPMPADPGSTQPGQPLIVNPATTIDSKAFTKPPSFGPTNVLINEGFPNVPPNPLNPTTGNSPFNGGQPPNGQGNGPNGPGPLNKPGNILPPLDSNNLPNEIDMGFPQGPHNGNGNPDNSRPPFPPGPGGNPFLRPPPNSSGDRPFPNLGTFPPNSGGPYPPPNMGGDPPRSTGKLPYNPNQPNGFNPPPPFPHPFDGQQDPRCGNLKPYVPPGFHLSSVNQFVGMPMPSNSPRLPRLEPTPCPTMEMLKKLDFNIMRSLVNSSGLSILLDRTNNYTLFVPSDAAFRRLPRWFRDSLDADNKLKKALVLNHLVKEDLPLSSLENEELVLSARPGGNRLRINIYQPESSYRAITVDGSQIEKGDILSSNGRIHIVQKVLIPNLPRNAAQFLSERLEFESFWNLVKQADLVPYFQDARPFTLFIPVNEAVAKLNDTAFLSDKDKLRNFIFYHMVNGSYYSNGLINNEFLLSNYEKEIKVQVVSDGFAKSLSGINGKVRILKPDISLTNGVAHVIDQCISEDTPFYIYPQSDEFKPEFGVMRRSFRVTGKEKNIENAF